ncbi:unnamed protein product, partial [Ectocarpus sp. 13 AM-2016]
DRQAAGLPPPPPRQLFHRYFGHPLHFYSHLPHGHRCLVPRPPQAEYFFPPQCHPNPLRRHETVDPTPTPGGRRCLPRKTALKRPRCSCRCCCCCWRGCHSTFQAGEENHQQPRREQQGCWEVAVLLDSSARSRDFFRRERSM